MSEENQDRNPAKAAPSPAANAGENSLQRRLFNAFLKQQDEVRAQVDHAGRLAAVLAIQQEIRGREPDLEEVLSLVASRAVSILGATGSAIALARDGAMVCRASAGATGPGLGAHLSAEFGLSGECIRTGQTMRCTDAETDPRVDRDAARGLGIRSMVVVPLYHHRTTAGVLEVFSSKAYFFSDEDAHVVELLGGLITTAISYSLEFEAKQTLESERSAMLQVIEQITPTIEKMLTHQQSTREGEDVEFGGIESLEPGEMQALAQTLAAQRFSAATPLPEPSTVEEGRSDESGFAAEEPPADDIPVEMPEIVAAPPSDHFGRENERDVQALRSAVEILLSKDNVLLPEENDVAASPTKPAAKPGAGERRPAPPREPAPARRSLEPLLPPTEDDLFGEPRDPFAPPPWPAVPKPAPPRGEDDLFDEPRDLFAPPPRPVAVPKPPRGERPSAAAAMTVPAPLSVGGGVASAPRGHAGLSRVHATATSTGPSGGVVSLPKPGNAVGMATTSVGSQGGGFYRSLGFRNLMEYAIPAVLTGLLIVVGLQWLTSHRAVSPYFGQPAMRAPLPSITPGPQPNLAPVEVNSLISSSATGLERTGKNITSRITTMIAPSGSGGGAASDWRGGGKLGGRLANLPTMTVESPSTPSRGAPTITGIENINAPKALASGNTVTLPSTAQVAAKTQQQVNAIVRLPGDVLQEFLVVKVNPIYPVVAQQNNIGGMVVLHTIIAPDGSVKEVRVISGNKYLAEAAVAAVSQWRYKPFVLNGKPVEIATEVRIAFKKQSARR